ncbi:hypothetical protein M3Y97_00737200 [Aphelenchoides bicaudatus]|nr:hypothetical protein M3Y97_00737200 [Aphelenchoides bicaudatus]
MSQVPFYTVDAFTSSAFKGNGAAVCIFKEDPEDRVKQLLSREFNLSETAFPQPLKGNDFQTASEFSLRWFTPTNEVPLCGHATLATAHVIFNEIGNKNKEIHFDTLTGRLTVGKAEDGRLKMNFPQYEIRSLKSSFGHFNQFETLEDDSFVAVAEKLAKTLVGDNAKITGLAFAPKAMKLIVVLDPKTTREQYMKVKADGAKLLEIDNGQHVRGIILTLTPAESSGFDPENDFVLRYFAPWNGIDEDPATGSAQCGISPFWAKILNKSHFKAFQMFPNRGADLETELDDKNNRINIFGRAYHHF